MKKLWIFGHSLCLPFNLQNKDSGWDTKLSKILNCECKNYAEPGADNFFIYKTFLDHKQEIKDCDIVVVGWSHYSRKVFELNKNNPNHVDCLSSSLIYHTSQTSFFRSNNANNGLQGDPNKWLNMKPIDSGFGFYDTWFNNYYSKLEQETNFQSYLDSVMHTCPGNYIPFYFNKESVDSVNIDDNGAGFIIEFILENKSFLSKNDFHMNHKGHQLWAEKLHKLIVTREL
jgi:hypothetical protein